MSVFKTARRWSLCLFARFCSWLFNRLPRRTTIYLGSWIGLTAWWFSPRAEHKSERHLSLALGDRLSLRARVLIGRGFYVNSGRNLADVLRMRRHFAREVDRIVEVDGLEHFDAAYREGRGVIGITGHIGNFELLAAFIHSRGYDVAVVGRELNNSELNRMLVANRASVGLTNIYTTDSPKRLVDWLKKGKVVGVLIDTDSSRVRGLFLPVFGRWGYSPVGQTILGLRCGAAFVPVVCLRLSDHRYRVIARPAIEPVDSGDFERDVYQVTLACNRVLEEIIRAHPAQWPWQHNRWRTPRPNRTAPLDTAL